MSKQQKFLGLIALIILGAVVISMTGLVPFSIFGNNYNGVTSVPLNILSVTPVNISSNNTVTLVSNDSELNQTNFRTNILVGNSRSGSDKLTAQSLTSNLQGFSTQKNLEFFVTDLSDQVSYGITNDSVLPGGKIVSFNSIRKFFFETCPSGATNISAGLLRYCVTEVERAIKGNLKQPQYTYTLTPGVHITQNGQYLGDAVSPSGCFGTVANCTSQVSLKLPDNSYFGSVKILRETVHVSEPSSPAFVAYNPITDSGWGLVNKSTFDDYLSKVNAIRSSLNTLRLSGVTAGSFFIPTPLGGFNIACVDAPTCDTAFSRLIDPAGQGVLNLESEYRSNLQIQVPGASAVTKRSGNNQSFIVTLQNNVFRYPELQWDAPASSIGIVINVANPTNASTEPQTINISSGQAGSTVLKVHFTNSGSVPSLFSARLISCGDSLISTPEGKTVNPGQVGEILMYLDLVKISKYGSQGCTGEVYNVAKSDLKTPFSFGLNVSAPVTCLLGHLKSDNGVDILECTRPDQLNGYTLKESCQFGVKYNDTGVPSCKSSSQDTGVLPPLLPKVCGFLQTERSVTKDEPILFGLLGTQPVTTTACAYDVSTIVLILGGLVVLVGGGIVFSAVNKKGRKRR